MISFCGRQHENQPSNVVFRSLYGSQRSFPGPQMDDRRDRCRFLGISLVLAYELARVANAQAVENPLLNRLLSIRPISYSTIAEDMTIVYLDVPSSDTNVELTFYRTNTRGDAIIEHEREFALSCQQTRKQSIITITSHSLYLSQ
ncbi:hypothetical protein ABW21_db0204053 [Orbilia brochopaga]|nr:hypothetical protein ABW21_db0204053 [Drechslerella brochopaga]